MDAESSMSKTTTYLCSSKMPYRIDEKAEEAAEHIKTSLRRRMEELRKVTTFCLQIFISPQSAAYLMHRPTIFLSDALASMITEGFALLEPVESRYTRSTYAPKQKLSEPLVVDAVIEFLNKNERDEDKLENVLRKFLFETQDDASSFGKAAEFYLAWVRSPPKRNG
jgi:hypothetical protein